MRQPLFRPEDVIAEYGDEQALDDGVIVAVSGRDRVTNTAFAWIQEHVGCKSQPPNRWPVDLFPWCSAERDADRAGDLQVSARRAVAAVRGVIGTYQRQAHERDQAGHMLELWADVRSDGVHGLVEQEPDNPHATRFWLVPNELGGITLMFPSDY